MNEYFNSYFHEFTPDMGDLTRLVVVMGMFLIAAVLLGVARYGLEKREPWHIMTAFSERWFDALSVLAAFSVGFFLCAHCSAGIVQWFDNRLQQYESPVASLIEADIAIVAIGVVFGVLTLLVGNLSSYLWREHLSQKRRRLLRQRFQRMAAAERRVATADLRAGKIVEFPVQWDFDIPLD